MRMSFRSLCGVLCVLAQWAALAHCDIDYNTINGDGSYSFRHSNDDIGGYYHSATGSAANVVRGRYGSKNAATGQVDEVVYTAGPRGFRAKGPKIHRKMDLAQYPVGPVGTPDDPLADPYDDPSYSFKFRTADQSRSEDNDATGRVRGLYSYIDDVGERHSVRYAAGAGTGFEVSNAVPDNPVNVGYTAPLYKAPPQTRGKMSVQRGPDGSYKLVVAGPDHRRAESRGPDGLVRGTYSFLDDKGVQRTVEYIAGAGIGYRVVKNRVGPGTHINPSVADFRLTDTDFRLANDIGRGASAGSASASRAGVADEYPRSQTGSGTRTRNKPAGKPLPDDTQLDPDDGEELYGGNAVSGGGRDDGDGRYEDTRGVTADRRPTGVNRVKSDRMGPAAGGRGGNRYRGSSADDVPGGGSRQPSIGGNDQRMRNRNRYGGSGGSTTNRRGSAGIGGGGGGGGASGSAAAGGGYNYDFNDDDVGPLPPLITANRNILEIDRNRDWVERHRDSTIIKNVGKWYIGLPPGQSVRAHVQNIDLLPLGGRRVPSPSEALRQDEIADMVASIESQGPYKS